MKEIILMIVRFAFVRDYVALTQDPLRSSADPEDGKRKQGEIEGGRGRSRYAALSASSNAESE